MSSETWKEYISIINEGKFDKKLMTVDNVIVSVNTNNTNADSHVSDRLKERSNITVDEFKRKLEKVIKKVNKKFKGNGTYLVIFKKSKFKIVFKYQKMNNKKDDMYILTILDIDMIPKNYDYRFYINESLFNTFKVELNNNEYVAYEEDFHQFIEFMNENNIKSTNGIEIFTIND